MLMRIAIAILVAVELTSGASRVSAQSALLNLPLASQQASLRQTIGITNITIDYHRPLVSGRKIFGGLVPYGKVWRAGANLNTTIAFSDPVTIEGQALSKGVYGLHLIPGATAWVVIFSKNSTSWGSFSYDQAEDALRVTVKPVTIDHQEALSYSFDDLNPASAVITMRWDTVAVPFKVEVDTTQIIEQSLDNQLRGRVQFEWQAWEDAAEYLLNNNLDPGEALKYADSSIENEDRFENEITKSRALSSVGRKDEAAAVRTKALALGSQQQVYQYARGLQRQGHSNEALEIFRSNLSKDPNSWIAHAQMMRLAVAQRDFDTALEQIKRAIQMAPESVNSQLADLVPQLENKVDVNQ
jgi:hypothetical protein